DRVFFPFSFGPFLGFWAAFEGAARRGYLAIPGGGMSTSARLRVLLHAGATVVAATPTYALRMAETAQAEGVDLAASPVRALIVAGEPGGSVPATKERIETAWGARCFDHSGMTEVGPFGFECLEGPGGMHAMEGEYIVEVIDPRTGKRIVPGSNGAAEGELVITNLGRAASPVLRYRTGDLVRWSLGGCACGRAEGRLEGGILGRFDDMIFVRGNNLYPSAIEAIIRKFPEVAEYRVRAFSSNEMTRLEIEVEAVPAGAEGKPDLPDRVASAIEKALLFKASVKLVLAGSLPRFEMKGKRFHKETV
ncbi:MAG TPA: phenylacetate--CoA ligase family protein, partial [Planctomycetota bacterium]|nr:phenylacetate--CoA ligase family protein [Planctomycetota bacterium]